MILIYLILTNSDVPVISEHRRTYL